MPIIYNGKTLDTIMYNGKTLEKVIYNGITVHESILRLYSPGDEQIANSGGWVAAKGVKTWTMGSVSKTAGSIVLTTPLTQAYTTCGIRTGKLIDLSNYKALILDVSLDFGGATGNYGVYYIGLSQKDEDFVNYNNVIQRFDYQNKGRQTISINIANYNASYYIFLTGHWGNGITTGSFVGNMYNCYLIPTA